MSSYKILRVVNPLRTKKNRPPFHVMQPPPNLPPDPKEKKNIQNSHSNIKNTKPTIFFFQEKKRKSIPSRHNITTSALQRLLIFRSTQKTEQNCLKTLT